MGIMFLATLKDLSVAYQRGVVLKTKEKLFNIVYLAGLFKHLSGVFKFQPFSWSVV